MRAFWAVLAALILGCGVYVVVSARAKAARAADAQLTAMNQAQSEASREAAAQARQEKEAAAPQSASQIPTIAETPKPEAANPQIPADSAAKSPEVPAPAAVQAPAEAPKVDAPKTDAPKTDAVKEPSKAEPSGFSIADGSVAPVGVPGTPTAGAPKAVVATVKQDKPATFGGFEVIPAKIEKKDDGSMLVDGQYLIKGEGTAEKPYLVPWEVLTSVEETFDPQAGKKKLPERVTMLDGKVVKLTGYIAFPLMMKEAKECLSMLNQWDGCCIGVPPTPYDAVEVSLSRTIKGEERFTTSGHVIGTLKVKPYLQGDWLIGLYVMEQGDLKSRDFGGSAGS